MSSWISFDVINGEVSFFFRKNEKTEEEENVSFRE